MTAFSEPDDDDDDDDNLIILTILERSQLTTSVTKKCFQVLDDSVHCFFDVDHFLGRCLSFTRNVEVVMSPHREDCIQKKAR